MISFLLLVRRTRCLFRYPRYSGTNYVADEMTMLDLTMVN